MVNLVHKLSLLIHKALSFKIILAKKYSFPTYTK